MTATEILDELKPLGKESYKNTMIKHGAKEPIFGVSIEEMKKRIVKRVKMDYKLALALYDTGVYDAQYLAGLIADDMQMTKKDLQRWIETANGPMNCEFTVPWVAAGSKHGWELGLKWIDSKKVDFAAAGWATLSSLVAIKDDSELDILGLKKLLERVQKTIHNAPNRVRYLMNSFVIATGSYVKALTSFALQVADKIGNLEVDLAGDCKLPNAVQYIKKVQDRGAIGKKRKSAKC
jgi:3-methyladenine DNA glycosylase AlkD